MEMNKKNPKLPRRDSSNSWSELPPDLFNSVFERLNFADFRRAGSVCSSWYSASKQCVTKNQTPWLILFPEDDDDHNCTLFNPEEKGGKFYKKRVDFAKSSVCLATYRSWLFMLEVDDEEQFNLYIMNLFTNERFNLPPVESMLGTIKLERTFDGWFRINSNGRGLRESQCIRFRSPVFWIDEETKDYVVVWGFDYWCVVYSKKGDEFWNQIPLVSGCSGIKDHKLYYLKRDCFGNSCIKIFDFSREIPQETFEDSVVGVYEFEHQTKHSWYVVAGKLVVTVKGDVLKVEKMKTRGTGIWCFRIYKV